ncbi:MAG: isoamylase early set domain-containing protein [Chloroflexi bacterium]|nr:isoamylase early set domain-containing protein [Chloroflexota bacterium]
MIRREPFPDGSRVRVTFACPGGPWADWLAVIGDFNGWNPRATPLVFSRNGETRSTTVELPAGRRYQFAYLADGVRCLEPEADGAVLDAPGGPASVLVT